jgi:rod shape-determining protein MreC
LHGIGSSWREKAEASRKQQDLDNQVAALQKQVDELTATNAKLQETAVENQKLRAYFQFFSEHKFSQKLARAVFQENYLDASRSSQNILIDRGANDGLIPGLAVINDSGVLVGKVLEVKESTARVCLLNSSSCKFAAAIQNQGRTIGVAEGDLGLAVKMNFIPLNEKISIDDIVVTSGLEKNVPAGLVAGSVNQIDINPNDIWQNITLKPLANLDNLDIISVLLP